MARNVERPARIGRSRPAARRGRRLLGEKLEPRCMLAASAGGSLAGLLFNDVNQDGIYEPQVGETPQAGRTVFVDLNGDGRLNAPSEPRQVTGHDGRYLFSSLATG